MLFELLTASAIATKSQNWEIVDAVVDGSPTCGISQLYLDGTKVLFVIDKEDAERSEFSFMAENASWSISEGEGAVRANAPACDLSHIG